MIKTSIKLSICYGKSANFYKFICSEEKFLYLNGKNVLDPKIANIVWKFIQADEN